MVVWYPFALCPGLRLRAKVRFKARVELQKDLSTHVPSFS